MTSRGAAAAEGRTWGVGMREGDLEDGLQAALGDGLLDIRGKTWVQRGHWLRPRPDPCTAALCGSLLPEAHGAHATFPHPAPPHVLRNSSAPI